MLSTVNLSLSMEREQYKMLLKKYQNALSLLVYQIYLQQRPVAIIMEGWDTAGKSGAIRRITEKIDPRRYMVYAIQSPSEVEASYHYLYRFWSRVPRKGQIAIFDHSWYDRILNERVNGNCTEEEWKRAFLEINSFERQLVDFGTILFKFWLHIGFLVWIGMTMKGGICFRKLSMICFLKPAQSMQLGQLLKAILNYIPVSRYYKLLLVRSARNCIMIQI